MNFTEHHCFVTKCFSVTHGFYNKKNTSFNIHFKSTSHIFEKNNEWILNTPPNVFQCTSVPTDLYVTFHNVLQYT